MGDILQQLEADGLANNTLVVFWSDHGRGFPREKRWPYECGLRVPLIVRWPGKIPPGSVRKELICTMDLAATTLTAAGLPVPAYMHAQPLFDAQGGRFRYMRNYHPDRPYMQHQEYADQTTTTWKELRQLRFKEAGELNLGVVPSLLAPARCPHPMAHRVSRPGFDA